MRPPTPKAISPPNELPVTKVMGKKSMFGLGKEHSNEFPKAAGYIRIVIESYNFIRFFLCSTSCSMRMCNVSDSCWRLFLKDPQRTNGRNSFSNFSTTSLVQTAWNSNVILGEVGGNIPSTYCQEKGFKKLVVGHLKKGQTFLYEMLAFRHVPLTHYSILLALLPQPLATIYQSVPPGTLYSPRWDPRDICHRNAVPLHLRWSHLN